MGDDLQISGGAGGITARYDDMLSYATVLDDAGDDLRSTSGDLAKLQRYFRVEGSGSPDRWLLKLQPLEPRAARLLREVRLGGVAAEVRSTVWVQGNGDEYAMQTEPLL